jgi:hypothetical protein
MPNAEANESLIDLRDSIGLLPNAGRYTARECLP